MPAPLSGPRLERALLKLHSALELEEVAKAVFGIMSAAVPCRYVGVWFQDVEFQKPLIFRIKPDFGYAPEKWKRFFEINPVGAIWAAHPGLKMWRGSDMWADEQWRSYDFYREFAQPQGWHYSANLGFWKGYRLLGGTSALRSHANGDFSQLEMRRLLRLYPYLDAALQRLDRLHAERNARAAAEQLIRRLPLPTLVLDWDLRVVYTNPAGRDSCALWNFGPEQARAISSRARFQVPGTVIEKCRELKTQWNGKMIERYILESPAGHPICHRAQPDLNAKIHLVQRSIGSVSKPLFRISFETPPGCDNQSTSAGQALTLTARLTRRERELVEQICQGAANKEIAARLSLSMGTVKKELNTLFQKLGVHSRSRLIVLMR
jgi:DNA-binding CsgD family transcriptional regulator